MNFSIHKTLLAGIVALVVASVFIVWNDRVKNSFRCPNEYGSVEAYVQGVTAWAQGELASSPDMTKEDLVRAREKLFRERSCEPSRWPEIPGAF